ncbi:hypothetical protein V7024_06735 [Bacillus sp. JJ864]|uniref:hypothetical protein n=1 Tax=Bacillus sp. JJ864 TaxID=3122975 RepID=UPI0030005600
MRANIKQVGPTCSIYALINALYITTKVKNPSREIADSTVCELLTNNLIRQDGNYYSGLTFTGEFFDFNKLKSFIDNNISFMHEKTIGTEGKYSTSIEDVTCLEDHDLINSLHNNEVFILFSIYKSNLTSRIKKRIRTFFSTKKPSVQQENVISHWVAICGYDYKLSKFIVTDSQEKRLEKYSYQGVFAHPPEKTIL